MDDLSKLIGHPTEREREKEIERERERKFDSDRVKLVIHLLKE
jgi:hypothetical protein